MKTFVITILLLFFGFAVFAQQSDTLIVQAEVNAGDTLMVKQLNEVEVFPKFKNRYQARRYSRLVRYVKKVYPYAKLAGKKLSQYDLVLMQAKNDRERKKLMKQLEQEINEEYGGELKDLTFTQGKILIKLIDRETGETSFNLVQELRGNFTAFFYQTFARVWGYNLKVRYDPLGEDKTIETIVKMIELGQI